MSHLAARPWVVASLNFVLATDPPPCLGSDHGIAEYLLQLTRVEENRSLSFAAYEQLPNRGKNLPIRK